MNALKPNTKQSKHEKEKNSFAISHTILWIIINIQLNIEHRTPNTDNSNIY